jgi:hypothetical protein
MARKRSRNVPSIGTFSSKVWKTAEKPSVFVTGIWNNGAGFKGDDGNG